MPSRRTTSAWASATALLLLLTGLVAGLPALPAHAAEGSPTPSSSASGTAGATAVEKDPLAITIDLLTPSSLKPDPTKGTITVSGVVTNEDTVTWQDINVYAMIDDTPLTTETELAEADLSAADQPWGERITTYNDFVTIPDLAPGDSYPYSLTIPRADLHEGGQAAVTQPGVYRFGVQALGGNAEGRDNVSDGRARTFLPLVAKPAKSEEPEQAALVVPIRQRVLRHSDGTLVDAAKWAASLSSGGRLNALLTFGEQHPVSWLVDPAVIDAVAQLADGDPPRSLAPTDGTTTPPPSASPSVASRAATDADSPSPSDQAAAAHDWLTRLTAALQSSPGRVFALPYGDLDLPAAAAHDPSLYAVARQRSTAVLSALQIQSTPADAPIDGYLPARGFALTHDAQAPVFLSDQAISGEVPAVGEFDGRPVVTTSSAVSSGGPAPSDRLALVAVRQQLLAQAALRLGTEAPVVAVLPASWTPGNGTDDPDDADQIAEFYQGLGKKWLQLTGVSDATTDSLPEQLSAARLRYPNSQRTSELSAQTFVAVNGLRQAGTTLQSVLSHNDQVATSVLDDALTSASYTARGGAGGAAAVRSREAIDALLRRITLEAPTSVTLSSASGQLPTTVVNGLDEDVTVKLRPVTDGGITLHGPTKLEIAAQSRASVLLSAHAHTNGVHTVTLELTDSTGHELGDNATLPIKTAQVSRIIWLFIACGLGLLFGAISVRLVRRIRRAARRTAKDAG